MLETKSQLKLILVNLQAAPSDHPLEEVLRNACEGIQGVCKAWGAKHLDEDGNLKISEKEAAVNASVPDPATPATAEAPAMQTPPGEEIFARNEQEATIPTPEAIKEIEQGPPTEQSEIPFNAGAEGNPDELQTMDGTVVPAEMDSYGDLP